MRVGIAVHQVREFRVELQGFAEVERQMFVSLSAVIRLVLRACVRRWRRPRPGVLARPG